MARPAQLPQMPDESPWELAQNIRQLAAYGDIGKDPEVSRILGRLDAGEGRNTPLWLDLIERLEDLGSADGLIDRIVRHAVSYGGADYDQIQQYRDALTDDNGPRPEIAPEWMGYAGHLRAWRYPREQARAAAAGGNIAQVAQSALHDPAERPEDFDALADAYESDFSDAAEGQRHSARIKRLRPTPVQPPAQMSRRSSPPLSRRKYAAWPYKTPEPRVAEKPYNIFDLSDRQLGQLYPHEAALLVRLSGHPDPDVAEMAQQAHQGDIRALLMLHDALLDSGSDPNNQDVAAVADLAGFGLAAAGNDNHNAINHRRVAVREFRNQVGRNNHTEHQKRLLPINREVIGEAMANLPTAPNPKPRPANLARQGRKRKLAKTQDTDGSFDQAMQRSLSGDQRAFRQSLDQMASQLGMPGRSASGIGDWEDGAEHSTVRFTKPADMDRLRYLGAWSGLTSNQKSVLVFNPSQGGLDSVYDMQVPERDMRTVRQKLSQAGVPFRTLIPGKKGTRVLVFDQGRALRQKVAQFAGGYGARIRESVGSGEYLGGGSRAAARAKYREVIAAYEAKAKGGQDRPSRA